MEQVVPLAKKKKGKTLINIQESLVCCYSSESNSRFEQTCVNTVQHPTLFFQIYFPLTGAIKGTALHRFIVCVFGHQIKTRRLVPTDSLFPKHGAKGGARVAGLNP